MSYLGIDPSSTTSAITAIGPRGALRNSRVWQRPKGMEIPEICEHYMSWLTMELNLMQTQATVVAVEELASSMNMDTTRKIAYIEGITLAVCHRARLKVIQVKATSARKLALGKGMKKKEAYEVMKERYGAKHYEHFKGAELDVSDSHILALAAKKLNTRP